MTQNEEFPTYCSNDCGRVLYKRDEAERVKFTKNLTGESWYDYVCKRNCEPQRCHDRGPEL